MNPLLLAALLAAPAPSRDAILRERHRAIDNAKEKALQKALQTEILYSAPIGPPGALGAQESFRIPLTGQVVLSDGRVLTLSGVLDGTLTTPAPTPTPVVTKLTGIRDAASALVTGGSPGQRLTLEGELLAGVDLTRLAIGGQIAPVSRQSATAIEFTVPTLPAGTYQLELWWLTNNNWQSKGRLPFTVKGTTPIPPPPGEQGSVLIDGFEDGAGNRVTSLKVNQPLVILGSGFGSARGRVLVNLWEVPIASWSPTRIQTVSGPWSNDSLPIQLHILLPDGRRTGPVLGPRVTP